MRSHRQLATAFAVTLAVITASADQAVGAASANSNAREASSSLSGNSVVIRSFGLYDLRRLGSEGFTLRPKSIRPLRASYNATRAIPYTLPEGASQGPKNWYVVRLHFKIRFTPGSVGYAAVGASPAGGAAALVEFVPEGAGMTWSTFSLIDGAVRGVTRSREVELRYMNYMTVHGGTPGRHRLVFWERHSDGMRVESVQIYPDSGIEYSPLGPARLVVSAHGPGRRVQVGETFDLRVRLKNVGERSAKYATISLEVPTGVESLGRRRRSFAGIPGKRSVATTFPLRASAIGAFVIGASVTASSNSPATSVLVFVRRS